MNNQQDFLQQKSWTCEWLGCGLSFTEEQDLPRHLVNDHAVKNKEKEFVCQWNGCNRTKGFPNRSNFDVHVSSHHHIKAYYCPNCRTNFRNPQDHDKYQNKNKITCDADLHGPRATVPRAKSARPGRSRIPSSENIRQTVKIALNFPVLNADLEEISQEEAENAQRILEELENVTDSPQSISTISDNNTPSSFMSDDDSPQMLFDIELLLQETQFTSPQPIYSSDTDLFDLTSTSGSSININMLPYQQQQQQQQQQPTVSLLDFSSVPVPASVPDAMSWNYPASSSADPFASSSNGLLPLSDTYASPYSSPSSATYTSLVPPSAAPTYNPPPRPLRQLLPSTARTVPATPTLPVTTPIIPSQVPPPHQQPVSSFSTKSYTIPQQSAVKISSRMVYSPSDKAPTRGVTKGLPLGVAKSLTVGAPASALDAANAALKTAKAVSTRTMSAPPPPTAAEKKDEEKTPLSTSDPTATNTALAKARARSSRPDSSDSSTATGPKVVRRGAALDDDEEEDDDEKVLAESVDKLAITEAEEVDEENEEEDEAVEEDDEDQRKVQLMMAVLRKLPAPQKQKLIARLRVIAQLKK